MSEWAENTEIMTPDLMCPECSDVFPRLHESFGTLSYDDSLLVKCEGCGLRWEIKRVFVMRKEQDRRLNDYSY